MDHSTRLKLLHFPDQDHELACLETVEGAINSDREPFFVAMLVEVLIEAVTQYDESVYRLTILGHLYALRGLYRDFYDDEL